MRRVTPVAVALLWISACTADHAKVASPAAPLSCLPGERGYLRIGLRGEIDHDLDWRGTQLQCEGGARPAGNGLRVSFAGAAGGSGPTLRIVFGISVHPGVRSAANRPTNITVIVEGQNRLYATQGEDKCQVESMVQEALNGSSGDHAYRVAARGYCVDPATTLDGTSRLYINRFDFAGVARFEDSDLRRPESASGASS